MTGGRAADILYDVYARAQKLVRFGGSAIVQYSPTIIVFEVPSAA